MYVVRTIYLDEIATHFYMIPVSRLEGNRCMSFERENEMKCRLICLDKIIQKKVNVIQIEDTNNEGN